MDNQPPISPPIAQPQMSAPMPEPKHGKLGMFITILVTALVAGSGVYAWQYFGTFAETQRLNSALTSTQDELGRQMDRVAALQTENNDSMTKLEEAQRDLIEFRVVKPQIISPADGEEVQGPSIVVKGTALSGQKVVAYINYDTFIPRCLAGLETAVNGGVAIADADGNFELELQEACSRDISLYVSAPPKAFENDLCYPEESISDVAQFTIVGELPAVCNQ